MQRVFEVVFCCVLFCVAIFGRWSSSVMGQFISVQSGIPPNLLLASESIPAPPQQSAAWKATETKLPEEFVSATATLFQQGLADPRGCEYREIEVVTGGSLPPWTGRILKTNGWVIPDTGKQRQRFGVCWNGLVYPLASVGEPADLRADAQTAANAELAHVRTVHRNANYSGRRNSEIGPWRPVPRSWSSTGIVSGRPTCRSMSAVAPSYPFRR